MAKTKRCLVAGLGLTSLAGAVAPKDYASACSKLASTFQHPNVTINSTQLVTAGTNVTFDQSTPELLACRTPAQVAPVDLCRVVFYVATSKRSGIKAEAWLPTKWTGRYMSTGNGGLNGCFSYSDIAYGTQFGFATIGSNNGHDGPRGTPFYQNADVVEDFAWRSIYTETQVGKKLTEAYYGKPLSKSYYFGCSTGGRQGFKMAQDYPELFDGILAGAPALAFNNLSSWSGHFLSITGTNTSDTFLSSAKWALVNADILKQCDSLDGAEDGILEDPNLCQYKPVTLQCPANATDTSKCLTAPQVDTVTKVFAPYYGVNGALIYPRMQPGSELIASFLYYNGKQFQYTTDWVRYAILQDPNWDPATLNSSLAAYAAALNPFNIETWNGDLSGFQSRGGKLLTYHGLVDPIISSDNSPRYYEHVATTMGLAPSDLDSFYRFFRISGMGHCQGGHGAWDIGQGATGAEGAQNNVLQRIIDWVEKDEAPVTLTGYKYVNDTKSLGVELERNHCKWPLRNKYVGPGSYKKAVSWKCVE